MFPVREGRCVECCEMVSDLGRHVPGVDLDDRIGVRSDVVAGLSWQQMRLVLLQIAQVGPRLPNKNSNNNDDNTSNKK
jgi:hypothetical protein